MSEHPKFRMTAAQAYLRLRRFPGLRKVPGWAIRRAVLRTIGKVVLYRSQRESLADPKACRRGREYYFWYSSMRAECAALDISAEKQAMGKAVYRERFPDLYALIDEAARELDCYCCCCDEPIINKEYAIGHALSGFPVDDLMLCWRCRTLLPPEGKMRPGTEVNPAALGAIAFIRGYREVAKERGWRRI